MNATFRFKNSKQIRTYTEVKKIYEGINKDSWYIKTVTDSRVSQLYKADVDFVGVEL